MLFPVPAGNIVWNIPMVRGVLSLDLSDRASGRKGQLAGIVPAEAMVASLTPALARINSIFCDPGSAASQALASSIRSMADILVDGTQDPAKTCKGVSIGLGFETRRTLTGDSVPAGPDDVCGAL